MTTVVEMQSSHIDPLRIAVIGLGGMGQGHVAGILATENTELVAVCDSNAAMTDQIARETGAEAFTDYNEMINQMELDGMVAVLPHHLHRDIVVKACNSGVALLKEKPLARNMHEAREFAQLVKQSGITFMLATQRRFTPSYARLKEIVPQLGHIFLSRGQYCFRWNRDFEWRGHWETTGGGALHDMGYHTIDMLNWYIGLPDWVSCEWTTHSLPEWNYQTDDTAVTMFGHKSGTIGYLVTTWASNPNEETFILHGTEGYAVANRQGITHSDVHGNIIEHMPLENSWHLALCNQIEHFASCVRHGSTPLTNAEINLLNMAFIEAAYRSASEKSRLDPHDYL